MRRRDLNPLDNIVLTKEQYNNFTINSHREITLRPIIILGMGMSGLVATLEALQRKQYVIVIEKYEFFSLNSTLLLNDESISYFKNLDKEIKGLIGKPAISQDLIRQFNELYTVCFGDDFKNKITTKYLQQMLFIACQIASNVYKSSKLDFKQGDQYQIIDIDMKNTLLILNNKQNGKIDKIKFQYIVDATGAKRFTLNYSSIWPWEVKQLRSSQSLKSFSCSMKGTTETGLTDQEAEEVKIITNRGIRAYLNKKFDLNLTRIPLFGFSITKKKKEGYRFHTAGELPDKISQSNEKIIVWAKSQLFFHIKKSTSNLQISYKDPKLSQNPKIRELKNKNCLSIFETSVTGMKKPIYSLSSGQGAILYLGDARLTHIFHLGEGANKAIKDGKIFGQCLDTDTNGNLDIQRFTELTNHNFQDEDERQNSEVLALMKL